MVLWGRVSLLVVALAVAALLGRGGWLAARRWKDPEASIVTAAEVERLGEHLGTGLLAMVVAWSGSHLLSTLSSEAGTVDALTMALVVLLAVPILGVAVWKVVTQRLADHGSESGHPVWAWHVAGVTAAATAVVLVSLANLVSATAGTDRAIAVDVARLVPWGAVLVTYVMLARRWLPRERRHPLLLATSLTALFVATDGFAGLMAAALPALAGTVLDAGPEGWSMLVAPAVKLVVGGVTWIVLWDQARAPPRTSLVTGYLLIMLSGGMLGLALGGHEVVADGLTWMFGERDGAALANFDGTPAALAAMAVGGLVWTHHRNVLGPSSPVRHVTVAATTWAAGVAAVVSLVLVGILGARTAMQPDMSGVDVFRSVTQPLAALVVATAIGVGRGLSGLGDRDEPVATLGEFPDRDEPVATHDEFPRHVLLVGPAQDGIVGDLVALTGAKVELHVRQDGVGQSWQIDALASSLAASDHDHVLVLAAPRGVTVIALGDAVTSSDPRWAA